MIEPNSLILGDCIEKMQEIPDKSIDCIITDLPYQVTACSWDCALPFDKMWEQYKRIIKPDRAICLFAQQPFTSALIMSNLPWYKYNWVWYKHSGANFLSSHYQPLKVTEDICVFGDGATSYTKSGEHVLYNPQFTEGKPYTCKSGRQKYDTAIVRDKPDAKTKQGGWVTQSDGKRYPTNVLDFVRDKEKWHPTCKPVDLLRYLIRTYSQVGGGDFRFLHGKRKHVRCGGLGTPTLFGYREGERILRHRREACQRSRKTTNIILIYENRSIRCRWT